MIDFNIFKKQSILITGDTGFKGSWLSFWLHQLGAHVTGYALPPEPHQRLFDDLGLRKLIRHIDGDIRDLNHLQKVVADTKPTFIFHLAAQPLVRLSYQEPKETFEVNVQGTVNLLEAARHCVDLRVLVCITSDKCYKNKEWVWGYRETDELGGHDPYSASKAAAELVFSSYVDSFFNKLPHLGVASVRAGNVIGGGDWSLDRIVPDAIKALQENRPIQVRNPYATRPWQHVLEPLSGYLCVAEKLYHHPKQYQGSWNFGPNSGSVKHVEQLVDKIIEIWGSGKKEVAVQEKSKALHEAGLLQLNCDKAHQLLGWHPKWSFEQAVRHTAEWYKQVHEGRAATDITSKQLALYTEAMQQ